MRARQRELGVPEAFEWVHETTPALLDVVRAAGLEVLEAPLMVLDRSVWRAPEPPSGMTLRVLAADDDALAAARAVQSVGFGAAGTAAGPEGLTERDAATDEDGLDFTRERLRRGLSVMVVAEAEYGPVAAGMHQPVDGVSEVVGVATLPAVRRQGLGGAVTGALVEDALGARRRDRLPVGGQRGHRARLRAARLPARRDGLRRRMRRAAAQPSRPADQRQAAAATRAVAAQPGGCARAVSERPSSPASSGRS